MIWPHTRKELQAFLTKINEVQKNIQLTVILTGMYSNFLNITIHKSYIPRRKYTLNQT